VIVLKILSRKTDNNPILSSDHNTASFTAFYLKIFRRFVDYMCRFSIRQTFSRLLFNPVDPHHCFGRGPSLSLPLGAQLPDKISEYSLQNLVQAGTSL
jgi:hypothetical protein